MPVWRKWRLALKWEYRNLLASQAESRPQKRGTPFALVAVVSLLMTVYHMCIPFTVAVEVAWGERAARPLLMMPHRAAVQVLGGDRPDGVASL